MSAGVRFRILRKLYSSSRFSVGLRLRGCYAILLWVDIPWMKNFFKPTLPISRGSSEAGY